MATHTVTATITVDVTNPAALSAFGSGDESAQVQAAVDAGPKELSSVASRYGFSITNATATVD